MHIEGYLENINFFADANDPTVTYAEVVVPAVGANNTPYRMFVEIDDEKLKSYVRLFVIPNINVKVTATDLIQEVKDIISLGGNPDTVAPRVRIAGKLAKGLVEYDKALEFVKYSGIEYVQIGRQYRVLESKLNAFLYPPKKVKQPLRRRPIYQIVERKE